MIFRRWSKVKKEAVKHYDNMIKWAKKQPKDMLVKNDTDIIDTRMFREINEDWFEQSCSYCKMYKKKCRECSLHVNSPYQERSIVFIFNCCNGLWSIMNESKTYGEFVKNAKSVRKYIIKHGK